ncbi:MAG: TIGR03619 family F420-dependent LLM class oxidoreductase [Deltaproteobacteria bacterium]|nr:MAG: TIGR03619 family F420-dependent LLM class oxidoreductase [Deltaproteobacteria bacterium]
MGPQSTRERLVECARAAEDAGLHDLWVVDHIAIPPDDAEGSDGRYLDPLATLAFLAGVTRRIGLGTAVLVLPYRPALPTAKWIATLQELSGGRLLLGVGVGWMEPEFRALGVPRARRGALTDAALDLFGRCFADDEVEENGQRFLFRPRPPRPPIFVGGAPPHAFERAARYGDGWMPLSGDPAKLEPQIRRLREVFDAAGRPPPEVVALAPLSPGDASRSADRVHALARVGVGRVIHAPGRYPDVAAFRRSVETLAGLL